MAGSPPPNSVVDQVLRTALRGCTDTTGVAGWRSRIAVTLFVRTRQRCGEGPRLACGGPRCRPAAPIPERAPRGGTESGSRLVVFRLLDPWTTGSPLTHDRPEGAGSTPQTR